MRIGKKKLAHRIERVNGDYEIVVMDQKTGEEIVFTEEELIQLFGGRSYLLPNAGWI